MRTLHLPLDALIGLVCGQLVASNTHLATKGCVFAGLWTIKTQVNLKVATQNLRKR
jgi:hypothetical protein